MIEFQIGDEVRVVGLPHCEWCGVSGVVVRTVERQARDSSAIQECAVQFPSGRRWFLSQHLKRAAPEAAVRFFRNEALERWRDLSTDDVAILNGNRDELIAILQERCGLSLKRAGLEADGFLSDLNERIRVAREIPHDSNSTLHPKASAA